MKDSKGDDYIKRVKFRHVVDVVLLLLGDMVKNESRVTSCELRLTSYELKT